MVPDLWHFVDMVQNMAIKGKFRRKEQERDVMYTMAKVAVDRSCGQLEVFVGEWFVLTPKFGRESDLWVQLGEESVWRKKGFLRCVRQKDPRSAICFRSAKEQLS
jgi:hypothetical protein